MKKIRLTRGKFALVDSEDFERLNQFTWFWHRHKAPKNGPRLYYALRNTRVGKKRKSVLMHREILHLKPGDPSVDHKDRNGLNNRKSNLRLATSSQNNMNKVGWNSIAVKGVRWHPRAGSRPFQARVTVKGRQVSCGYYPTTELAARAYNAKAIELFGEFARLNPA